MRDCQDDRVYRMINDSLEEINLHTWTSGEKKSINGRAYTWYLNFQIMVIIDVYFLKSRA